MAEHSVTLGFQSVSLLAPVVSGGVGFGFGMGIVGGSGGDGCGTGCG